MQFSLAAPQLIYLSLALFSILGYAVKHGQPLKGHYNVFTLAVAQALSGLLLWWGGFFDAL